MREKWIRWPILILLILLNAGLFVFYLTERRGANTASVQEINRVVDLYGQEDITFKKQPAGTVSPRTILTLGSADLDQMVIDYLQGADYDLTYIYGAKVQYNSDSLVIIADWDDHSITYRDNLADDNPEGIIWGRVLSEDEQLRLETAARTFAQKWLGDSVVVTSWIRSGEILTVTLCQVREDQIYYFNNAEVTVNRKGISEARIEYWNVVGENAGVDPIPMDEMLYAALNMIKSDENMIRRNTGDQVISLTDGFEILSYEGEEITALPCLTLVMESGRQFHLSYVRE